MKKPKKIKREYNRRSPLISVTLDTIARDFVGDGKDLNAYFVTDNGSVVMITFDKPAALTLWRKLAGRYPLQECALEDRKTGTLASVEPAEDEEGSPLRVYVGE